MRRFMKAPRTGAEETQTAITDRSPPFVKNKPSLSQLLQPAGEPWDGALEFHAVPRRLAVAAGELDGAEREIHRQLQRLLKRQAAHQAAHRRGGEQVARAVVDCRIAAVEVGEEARAVIAHHADLRRVKRHACEHGLLRAQLRQAQEQRADVVLVVVLAVFRPRQKTRLRQVRGRDVRTGDDLRHSRGKVRAEAGVEPAVVSHGRVDEEEGIVAADAVIEVADLLHLLARGDIARIDCVKVQVLAAPVLRDRAQLVSEVLAGEVFKRRVRAQHCRRHAGALDTHRRDGGQRHRQRTSPEAGDVLNTCDTLHGEYAPSEFVSAQYTTFARRREDCGENPAAAEIKQP